MRKTDTKQNDDTELLLIIKQATTPAASDGSLGDSWLGRHPLLDPALWAVIKVLGPEWTLGIMWQSQPGPILEESPA